MLTTETKRHIDAARQVLVGVVPNPTSQIDQITNALIYKFMDDMDQAAIKQGDEPSFFVGNLERYGWTRLMDSRIGNQERMNLYSEALIKFSESKQLPDLFRGIFKSAFLPYRSPEVLGLFLKEISFFDYSHPEELGNAYEYLLSIMSSQGDAGQFRTPRHIIDFIVAAVNPTKYDQILDPACGTGGFLVSAYKHILKQHDGLDDPEKKEKPLTPDERRNLMNHFEGYDIDPSMARIAQVNMYLHQFKNPKIVQYDTLSMDERWNEKFDVILANPPFMSPKGGVGKHNKFSIDSSRSEVLFVDYIINHLRSKGRAGVIVPEGIIFQSGNAYKQLRKNLVEESLYAVVSLPSGVFQPYSGVKTSILFFDKELAKQKKEILFIDVKDIGISLGATRRPIERNDLTPALETIKAFQDGDNFEPNRLAFATSKQEITSNSYNLSLAKYKKHLVVSMEKPFVSISEICNITKGKSSSTKTKSGMFPLYLTAKEYKTADHFDFDGEGVCVPLISATGHGKAAIKRVHYVKGKFALANLLAFVSPNDINKISATYLFYILDSAKDNIAKLMNGAANVSMKTSDLGGFQIPLASLEIQQQIVAELDGYQKIIAGAKQIIANWKPSFIQDSSWILEKLSDTADFQEGPGIMAVDFKKEGVPLIRLRGLSDNYASLEGCNFLDPIKVGNKWNHFKLRAGDLLLSTSGSLGMVSEVNQNLVGSIAYTGIIRFRPKDQKIDSSFLKYFLISDYFTNQAEAASTGVTLKHFGPTHLSKMKIMIPPVIIQKQIVGKIEAERVLIDSAKKLIEIYEQKTKSTIAKLWNA